MSYERCTCGDPECPSCGTAQGTYPGRDLTGNQHFCFYCHDTKFKPTWERMGGTIGERHYVCHRKKCQKRHALIRERSRALLRVFQENLAKKRKEREGKGSC